jgi:hypothetical protein
VEGATVRASARRIGGLASALLLLCTLLARGDEVLTDYDVHPEPPLPPLPSAGGTIVDPTFGTTIMRLTDRSDGADLHDKYAYWPTFNRDSTRLRVQATSNQQGILYRFDPDGFRLLSKETLWAMPSPQGFAYTYDSIWSGADADVVYAHTDRHLWAYDVSAKAWSLVRDFGDVLPVGTRLFQMSKSLDDQVFGFTIIRADNTYAAYFAWRRGTNDFPVMHAADGRFDECQVDKSGRWLVERIDSRVHDLVTGTSIDVPISAADNGFGHGDNGVGTIVAMDGGNNWFAKRQLSDPLHYLVCFTFPTRTQTIHLSALADDEGWGLVSGATLAGQPRAAGFCNEIFQIATDGSRRVRRLAHHRSVCGTDYYGDSPRADISRDGRFVTFVSNWGVAGGPRDFFILRIPSTTPVSTSTSTDAPAASGHGRCGLGGGLSAICLALLAGWGRGRGGRGHETAIRVGAAQDNRGLGRHDRRRRTRTWTCSSSAAAATSARPAAGSRSRAACVCTCSIAATAARCRAPRASPPTSPTRPRPPRR